MYQIVPYSVWIGSDRDGRAFRELFDLGIRAVVQVAIEEPAILIPRELLYLRFPLIDGSGNDADWLRLALHSIKTLIQREIPTLVCCSAGMSRSPALVGAVLMSQRGMGFEESVRFVTQNGPADLSGAFLTDLKNLLQS